ncbi:endosialidase-like protein [Lutibacter sp. Hel_I_33_5]|uniref:tail fiber domain-containing protein n=1 Tax=Lutibacter sp. Hel_I_33_5 TaxID=1566289 RepID=UPI0011A8C2B6|nr:tail fiber domain-containing protein [Lutibacter sp. Hel_I_33_5]TVZ55593.1 endosialidase-like protein [Lutibacter sp. Hel_I_33_5]
MEKINIVGTGDSGPVGGGKINENFKELVDKIFGKTIWDGNISELIGLDGLPTNNKSSLLAAIAETYYKASSIDDTLTTSTIKTWSIDKLNTTFVDNSELAAAVASLVGTAPEALNALGELSDALGDDPNFATTTATSLGNRLRIDVNNQNLTSTQKTNGITNLGLESWITAKGYLTSHQSLSGYATQSWVNSRNYLTSLPSNLAYTNVNNNFLVNQTFGGVMESTTNGNRSKGNLSLGLRSNNTTKWHGITGTQYAHTNESEGYSFINGLSSISYNNINIGGGLAEQNSANKINFYTTPLTNTRTGTVRATIESNGLLNAKYNFRVNGTSILDDTVLIGTTVDSGYALTVWGTTRLQYDVTINEDLAVSNNVSIGQNLNVISGTITTPSIKLTAGATNGYFLRSDAAGNGTWQPISASQVYKGTYNASTNSPSLSNGTGTGGDFYRVVVAGTRDFGAGNITFAVGDDVSYTGSVWEKIPAQSYILQTASSSVLGGVKVGDGLSMSGEVMSVSSDVARKNIDNNFSVNQTILTDTPILSIQDSNSTGNSQTGYLAFRDDTSTVRGWIGFGDTNNTYLNINNIYDLVNGVRINNNTVYHAGNFVAGTNYVTPSTLSSYVPVTTLSSYVLNTALTSTLSNYITKTGTANQAIAGALEANQFRLDANNYMVFDYNQSTNSKIRYNDGLGMDYHSEDSRHSFYGIGATFAEVRTGNIITTGTITATGNITSNSDRRLKKNIRLIQNPLDILKELRGVRFDWISSGKSDIGSIADEIEKVTPEFVVTADDAMKTKSVDYGRISSLLIETNKALLNKIEALENKLQQNGIT